MRIGIIGAGTIGQTVGRLLAHGGHTEAVLGADAVLFAPRFEHINGASQPAGTFAGRAVIDTTNPYLPERDGLVDLGEQTRPVDLGAVADSARQAPDGSYYGEEFHVADVPALPRI